MFALLPSYQAFGIVLSEHSIGYLHYLWEEQKKYITPSHQ